MIKKYFNENPNAVITPWFKHSSSFIRAIRYDKRAGTLFVQITKVYDYQVPIDLADEFSRSASWGRFYDTRIKEKHAKKESISKQPIKIGKRTTETRITPEQTANWKDMGQMEDWIWTGTKTLLYTAVGGVKTTPIGFIAGFIGIELLDYFLETKGIDEPFVAKVALNAYTGYNIYAGIKRGYTPVMGRGKEYFGSLFTPYGSAGYSSVSGFKANLSAHQVGRGIAFGGKTWESMLTTERLAYGSVVSSYKGMPMGLPRAMGPFTKTEEILRKINKYGDLMPDIASGITSAAYLTYEGIQRGKEIKKKKKPEKPVVINFTETGMSLAIRGITHK